MEKVETIELKIPNLGEAESTEIIEVNIKHGSEINENDRKKLRDVGYTDRDIWDISAIVGLFNMTNRLASATEMEPNNNYHNLAR